jgi:hypothetical protein
MNTFLPPSKTPVSDLEIERFNHLHRKVHARLAPGNAEEYSLCDEIVVGLWHFRSFRALALAKERQLRRLRKLSCEPTAIEQTSRELASALRQAKKQKNFAWRRRNKFFSMKTVREDAQRLPLAA